VSKPGANDVCPCGSGKKYKKCCRDKSSGTTYTLGERESAYAKLDEFIGERFEAEADAAFEEFWGRLLDQAKDLPEPLASTSEFLQKVWFVADEPLEGGETVVDVLLAEGDLTLGEKAFLNALRRSSMRLYETVEVVPGVSLTLRDVVEGGQVTVNERMGSRSINRFDWLATRVVPRGPSGGPEMEGGVIHVARMFTEGVLAEVQQDRTEFFRMEPGADATAFFKTLPPFFHDVWAGSILAPQVPELRNPDGEEVVLTKVRFDVVDAEALTQALDSHADLTADGAGGWSWSATNPKGTVVSLGTVKRAGDALVLEANSMERAARGRALVEAAAGAALRHRATSHDNIRLSVQQSLREKYLRREGDEPDEPEPSGIPMAVQESLVLEHLGKHYRAWVDEPVPALEGQTPRQAAGQPKLRPRLDELIHGLEGMYQQALRERQPAYDPSWMWNELGLADKSAPFLPPPLAHERVAERVLGSGDVSRAAAERLRRAPGFSDATSSLSAQEFAVDIELQRFLREHTGAANDSGGEGSVAAPYLRLMVNFDLHRRKAFWVDEALGYMLGHTDLDVTGSELRVPFASFAVVFTDRHVLSLAERVLSREENCPSSGHILRVATVYVTEEHRGDQRVLDITFALDALGADLPALVRHEVVLDDGAPVQRYLDAVAPLPVVEPMPVDANPVRGLLRTTINAILYATSAGAESVTRKPATPRGTAEKAPSSSAAVFSSDEVYFLPGAIDITRVRHMQELERVPSGREALRRFMVRGHWRRANKGWVDQSLRWVQPYWKGPDIAAVIERTYRLKE
jgi:hypothetical protein